ncbi:hypothetical protein JW879_09715 [candidate division WOR-3 bacterium]|nr:hypothetical protein [candidate division WOR-3 bacterium]
MKKIVFSILLIFFSFLFCFLIADLILRLINYPKVLLLKKDDSDYIQYDDTLGYRYLPNLDIEIKNENYCVQVKTNSFGFRDDEWNFDGKYKSIFVLGNSFSAGYGLPVAERWSNRLNYLLNIETEKYSIYNISVSAYNMKQMIEAGSYLSSFVKPQIIIMGLYLDGLSRLHDPYVFYNGFAIRSSHVKYAKIKNNRLMFTHFESELMKNIESFAIVHSVFYNFIINKMQKLKCFFNANFGPEYNIAFYGVDEILPELKSNYDRKNIKLIILPILQHDENRKFRDNDLILYKELKHLCNENKIYFADILPQMEKEIAMGKSFFIRNDSHWNEDANQIAAQSLYLIIDKLSCSY